jgi:hypothetical protein
MTTLLQILALIALIYNAGVTIWLIVMIINWAIEDIRRR